MINNFGSFISESIKMSDPESQKLLKKIVSHIDKFKYTILGNIEYDFKKNVVVYKKDKIFDPKKSLSEIEEAFDEDIIEQLNVEAFLVKLSQILDLKKRNTKKKIKEEFKIYFKSLDQRFKESPDEYIDQEGHLDSDGEYSVLPRKKYEGEKYNIQVELLKLQEWVVKNKKRVAIVFEGRDAAGKGSTIKRFIEYLNPRHFRVVALGVPTEEEKNSWLERYEKHLPKPGEIVFFDRSWYNRAVVEPAMGYCDEDQYKYFITNVLDWEEDLIDEGLILIKFWFSISKEKQQLRFNLRKNSPLKYWKFSPNDAKVIDKWDIITKYKNQMFTETSSKESPWIIVNSNDKKIGRLNAMRYVLSTIGYDNKDESKSIWYPEVINVVE